MYIFDMFGRRPCHFKQESMSSPEPEPDVTPEPETEIKPEPEGEPESAWAEPEPEWSVAFSEWGAAWELHVYIFASCYLLIVLLALSSLTYFFKNKVSLKRGKLTVSLLAMVIIFTVLRSITLFVDPYGTRGTLPDEYFRALWSLALPGLTASFSVLLLVLLDTTKMSLGPPRFQKLSTILIFTACHFAIVVASEIVFSICQSCKGMLLFCQILFIIYGALLAAGYLYSGVAIHKNCAAGNRSNQGYETKRISRLSKAAAVASATAFTIFVTYIYAASSEFGIYSDQNFVDAWHWWSLQTVLRLEEIVACCLVLVIAFRNPFGAVHCFKKLGNSRTLPDTQKTSESLAFPTVTVSTIRLSSEKRGKQREGGL